MLSLLKPALITLGIQSKYLRLVYSLSGAPSDSRLDTFLPHSVSGLSTPPLKTPNNCSVSWPIGEGYNYRLARIRVVSWQMEITMKELDIQVSSGITTCLILLSKHSTTAFLLKGIRSPLGLCVTNRLALSKLSVKLLGVASYGHWVRSLLAVQDHSCAIDGADINTIVRTKMIKDIGIYDIWNTEIRALWIRPVVIA